MVNRCTGKLYVRNFPAIAGTIRINNISNLFWRWLGDGTWAHFIADCRFYYTSKSFAKKHLLPAYLECNDSSGVFCEDRVREAVDRNMKAGKSVRPHITGYSGGTGEPYFDSSLGSLDYDFPCWVTQR